MLVGGSWDAWRGLRSAPDRAETLPHAPQPDCDDPAGPDCGLLRGAVRAGSTALTSSAEARALYDADRAPRATHHSALRALSNRLVRILHGCLRHYTVYNPAIAWPDQQQDQPANA